MNHKTNNSREQAIKLVYQLETILKQLDAMDAKIPAIHIETAIMRLSESYDLPHHKISRI